MTPRLYFEDPFLWRFDAHVVAHGSFGGRPSLLLDRTAFYPEAGGQMADHGTLGGSVVSDVQVDDEGLVHHLVEGALPEVGEPVAGQIEAARRRLFMALHTGQHMLSRALVDVAGLETVSSRLGESQCTIDVDGAQASESNVAKAEDLVNAVIDDDLNVRAFFPSPSELATLPLRRKPKVSSDVRVVAIGDFDVSPCGGTHCTRTAQVGLLAVTGLEKYKGKWRITFSAGARARRELAEERSKIVHLAKDLSCGTSDVPGVIEKLRRELGEARENAGRLRSQLATSLAEELLTAARQEGQAVIVAELAGWPVEHLRVVAAKITDQPGHAAVLTSSAADGVMVVVARGEGSSLDCGDLMKRLAAKAGGRGGGRPERAEGRLPLVDDVGAMIRGLLHGFTEPG